MKPTILLLTILLSALLASLLTIYFSKKSQSTCIQKNKESVIRLIEEVWNKGNFEIVDQLVAPQYTIRNDPGDQWEGKTLDISTYIERVKMSHDILPDQKFYIEDIVCEGDKVALSWRFTGTQKGDIPGLPATNKPVNVSGLTIYYFSNGKTIGHWQVFDKLSLLAQLGVQIGNLK